MISAIILAAGKSTRMGYPKALVNFGGRPFLHNVTENFSRAGIENVLVVLGHQSEKIATELALPPHSFVVNEKYEMGQFSSLQAGIRELDDETEGAFLALVDQPQIGAEVIRGLLASFSVNPKHIVLPTYRGKRGHPTLFPRKLFEEIKTAPPTISARDILTKHQSDILEVETNDESILWNINSEQDFHWVQRRMKQAATEENIEEK